MAEDIFAKPDVTKKVRFQTGENEDRNTDECDVTDKVRIYDNYWADGSTPPKSQDITTEDQQQSIHLSVAYVLHDTVFKITYLFAMLGETLHFMLRGFAFQL